MKISELKSIWEPDLSRLSGRDRGQIYYQRCQVILGEAIRSRRAVITNNRIDRDWLRNEIGCTASVLAQNAAIRALVEDRDELFKGLTVRAPFQRRKVPQARSTRSHRLATALQMARFSGKISFITLVRDSLAYQVPLLQWGGRIDEEVSDWLRHLALSIKAPETSLKTYSSVIRDFTRFRRRHQFLWDEVDDGLIQKFQSFKLAKGVKADVVNQYTDIVFGFYIWLEETGRLTNHVQLSPGSNTGKKRIDFNITSKSTSPSTWKVDDAPGRVWNHRLTLSDNSKKDKRHTPNKEEIGRLQDSVLDQKHGERNLLLFLWAEKTGARRFEVLQITVQDLPTEEGRDEIADKGGTWAIQVFRKGRDEKGNLFVPVDLLRLTAQYVKYERSKIVTRCQERGVSVSDSLFLTDKGKGLAASSLTGLSRAAFIKAGVLRSSYHRLRAVFATQETKKAVEALESGHMQLIPGTNWTQTILLRVAELLDHSNLESLEHYLNNFLNARIQRAQATSGIAASETIEYKRKEIEALDRRIDNRIRLMEVMANLNVTCDPRIGAKLEAIGREVLTLDD
ncbi:hypothetical protein GR223_23400 [Rhizobium leguminosarum]|uniref:tyrosine-type recombinase/integrase n=1 Tax=Rhizobium ruizarguesonis TaxID=2081791 RepID=UPI0013E0036B|nr:site-specific integrase [Rhizobium ruizarguesonis]NEJ88843.1 hypothetical protein [Rhizobium ruizarguesonis]